MYDSFHIKKDLSNCKLTKIEKQYCSPVSNLTKDTLCSLCKSIEKCKHKVCTGFSLLENELESNFSRVNSQVPLSPQGDDDRSYQYSEAEVERGTWTGKFDFLLSLLGYSVGLGNVWRFPYLCYSNGGGAFLIPFICMMLLAGLPLMFMELSFGQYASLGPIAIFDRFCPLFTGLGYGMVIVSGTVMLYYNMIIAWTIFYMFASWNSRLPWDNCAPEWSTQVGNCIADILSNIESGDFYVEDSKNVIPLVPYRFQYNHKDDFGNMQHREENKGEDGVVRGSYGYRDSNGVYRHVSYVADAGGFHAVLRTNEPGVGNRNSADVAVVAQLPTYSVSSAAR